MQGLVRGADTGQAPNSDLPQFLFDFERAATAGTSHALGAPSPSLLAHQTPLGPATAPAALSLSAPNQAGKAAPDASGSAAPLLPLHRNSDPGGDLDHTGSAAAAANGIPCRRSPMSFAGRIPSGGVDPLDGVGAAVEGTSPAQASPVFGGRSFPGDFPGLSSPLFPGSLMEVPSTEVGALY